MNPIVHMNHSFGRCLGITVQTSSSTIRIYNVYAFNEHSDRTSLWQALHQQTSFDGIICGNFNVVLEDVESTTRAAFMTWEEKT